ncbi:MAG TPA: periplasmic heavy metal sensor [Dongiaceae bacterium]|jgi:Spy/CpxP family protein refolding chaperone|nr:periplasmic heavy metal sensor [Dongiaceae bacterium]
MTLTGRTGTAVVAAAIVSLCLNMLLAGFLIGGRWHDEPGRGPFFRNIPEEARSLVKGVFDAHKSEFDTRREAVQQARQKVADVLKADPIDQARLNQALSELLQQTQAMQQFGHQVMVEVAQKLTPEQRRAMADGWAKDRFMRKPEP